MADDASASAPAPYDVRAALSQRKSEREEAKRLRATARAQALANEAQVGEDAASARIVTAAQFWTVFDARIASLRSQLAAEGDLPPSAVTPLQALLNECATLLPPFDVKKATVALERFKFDLNLARNVGAPRPRFRFTRRETPAPVAPPPVARATSTATVSPVALEHAVECQRGVCIAIHAGSGSTSICPLSPHDDGHGRADDTANVVGLRDLRLTDLNACSVLVTGVAQALRIDRLADCNVYVAAVHGSLLIHDCQRCAFHVAGRQVRVHNSTDCDFNLHVASRPIVEGCDRCAFAPLTISNGPLPVAPNAWEEVQDFNWLRAQASPHWRVKPVAERESTVPPHVAAHGFTVQVVPEAAATPAAAAAVAVQVVPAVAAGSRVAEEDDEL